MNQLTHSAATPIVTRLADVKRRIDLRASAAGRDAEQIKLICVSKTHPVEVLREAFDAARGTIDFGENRVQEAESKIAETSLRGAGWHLIGNLQANKARRAVKLFDVIQTLDSSDLAKRLDRLCAEEAREKLPVLIQVRLADEATKAGVEESELPALIDAVKECPRLRLMGLMTIPPFFEDAERVRPFFSRLRELRDELRARNVFENDAGELSMGMSNDYEVAIEEGATMLRVGTAIFGERAAR